MIAFLCAVLVLLAICLLVLLRPLLRTQQAKDEPADLELQVLREQRRDLDAELAAGHIDAATHAQGLCDLERRLVREAVEPPASAPAYSPRRMLALSLVIVLPLLAGGVYFLLGNPAALNPANVMAQEQVTPDQLNAMVAKLEAKVKDHPEDLQGMRMLARSYMVLERFPQALEMYKTLATKSPDDAGVYADWADALVSTQNGRFEGEPMKLIDKALSLDPKNVKALALASTAAFDAQDYQTSIRDLEQIVPLIDPQSDMGQSVQAMLTEARARAKMPAGTAPIQAPAAAAQTPVKVTGHVSLAADLKAKVLPEDSVFVFARPAAGGPPLAAMRFKASDLPMDFDFKNAQAMMGSASASDKILVVARISKSGNVMPVPGDLQGASKEIGMDAKGVKLVIDQEIK